MNSTFRLLSRTAAALLVTALGACANLDAVRAFGKSAAEISSYPEAANLYRDSAVTLKPYLTVAARPSQQLPQREQQAKAALQLQASVAKYFAMLAKLAGEDAFSLDTELDDLGSGLKGLPQAAADAAGNATDISTAFGLIDVLARYTARSAQASAVRDLVKEGGPSAMRLVDSLQNIAGDWAAQVDNDAATVLGSLDTLALGRDINPLLRQLANDRSGELARRYAASKKKFALLQTALRRVAAGHAEMEKNLDDLSGAALRARLKTTVAELRAARADLVSMRD